MGEDTGAGGEAVGVGGVPPPAGGGRLSGRNVRRREAICAGLISPKKILVQRTKPVEEIIVERGRGFRADIKPAFRGNLFAEDRQEAFKPLAIRGEIRGADEELAVGRKKSGGEFALGRVNPERVRSRHGWFSESVESSL